VTAQIRFRGTETIQAGLIDGGADLVCSAGATSFGAGWEGASAGRGGGNGGDAAVDALEACSGKRVVR